MTVTTMVNEIEPGRGEQRLKENRKRYTRIIVGLMAAGGVVGALMGLPLGKHLAQSGFRDNDVPSYFKWLAIAGVLTFVIAVAVGSWRYFRTIDELEYEANKSAGLIGLNVYAMLFMCWWPLAKAGVTPPPNGEAIFLITMAAAVAAFCWRRFR